MTKTYDWRKERAWIENPLAWLEGRLLERFPDENFTSPEAHKMMDRLARFNYTFSHLEPTEEERIWWKQVYSEIADRDTLSFFAHPFLGEIAAIYTLKRIDIAERLNVLNLNALLNPYEGGDTLVQDWRTRNTIVKHIAHARLTKPFDRQSFDALLMNNFMLYANGEREPYVSVAWHAMIQHNSDIAALPYIGMIPKEERDVAIDAYMADKAERIKKEIQEKGYEKI